MTDLVDHPEGIYFGLPEEEYFSDIAIGSTDMRALRVSAPGYWFNSRYNPVAEEKEPTPALLYGRAVHTLILEGEQKFKRMYAPKMLSWSTKEGRIEKEKFEQRGLMPLSEKAWARALQTGAILRGNPYLAEAFEDSVGHEVTVFWRDRRGVKKRARFDALKERSIVDLKNVSNERNISFPEACLRKINDYSYHMQSALYTEGRMQMKRLMNEGKVYGEFDEAPLRRAVDAPAWAFVFIFIQSAGAPEVWPTMFTYRPPDEVSQMLQLGFAHVEEAVSNWIKFNDKFGTDLPWVVAEPIKEFDITQMPAWFLRGSTN